MTTWIGEPRCSATRYRRPMGCSGTFW
jgi:hypothetical protein